jgi:mono/diheme cytochrome c family protein
VQDSLQKGECEMKMRGLTLGILAAAVAFAMLAAPAARAQDDIPVNMTYQIYCSRCHGADGKGDGPDGATLSPKPRDFADCAVMGKIPDATIVKAIKEGGAAVGISRDMPAWGEALSDKKIDALAAYVRTFCHK